MRERIATYILVAALAVVAAFLPSVITTPYLLHILILTLFYFVLAISYDIVVGHVGALSLGHPAFLGIGAYAAALLVVDVGGLPDAAIFGAGAVVAALAALAIGIPSFRLGGHSFAIGTLGFALIVELVARNWIPVTRGPAGIPGIPPPSFSFGELTILLGPLDTFYYLALVLAIVNVALYRALVTSRTGRAFRAIRENELLALTGAVHATRYKLLAFTVAGAMAGVMGAFYAYWFGIVSPEPLGLSTTITLLLIVFIGGRTSLPGIAVASILIAGLPELLRVVPELRLILYGAILLVTIMYFPGGIGSVIDSSARRIRRFLGGARFLREKHAKL